MLSFPLPSLHPHPSRSILSRRQTWQGQVSCTPPVCGRPCMCSTCLWHSLPSSSSPGPYGSGLLPSLGGSSTAALRMHDVRCTWHHTWPAGSAQAPCNHATAGPLSTTCKLCAHMHAHMLHPFILPKAHASALAALCTQWLLAALHLTSCWPIARHMLPSSLQLCMAQPAGWCRHSGSGSEGFIQHSTQAFKFANGGGADGGGVHVYSWLVGDIHACTHTHGLLQGPPCRALPARLRAACRPRASLS